MDTFAGIIRDPYSLHKYLYAHANPVNMIDPSGMMSDYNQMLVAGSIIGAFSGMYIYHVTHPPEERDALGYVTWGSGGALIGGLLAHGAWYLQLYMASAATGGFTAAQAEFLRRGQYGGGGSCVECAKRAQELFTNGEIVQVMTSNWARAHYVLKLPNGWILDPSYLGNFRTYAQGGVMPDRILQLVGNKMIFDPVTYEELRIALEKVMTIAH